MARDVSGGLEIRGAVPQTALIALVTSRYSSGSLNFATYSSENYQRDRRCRSARLQRTGPKKLF